VIEVVELAADAVVAAGEGIVQGEATLGERPVRVIALSALGGPPAGALTGGPSAGPPTVAGPPG
jgi:hypothetical protein